MIFTIRLQDGSTFKSLDYYKQQHHSRRRSSSAASRWRCRIWLARRAVDRAAGIWLPHSRRCASRRSSPLGRRKRINTLMPFTKITNEGLWHLRFSYLLRIPPFFFFQFLLVLTYQLFLLKGNLNVLKEFFCSCKLKHYLPIILIAFLQMIL